MFALANEQVIQASVGALEKNPETIYAWLSIVLFALIGLIFFKITQPKKNRHMSWFTKWWRYGRHQPHTIIIRGVRIPSRHK